MMMRLQMQLDATCRPLHARPRPRLSLDTSDKSQRAQLLQPLFAATATATATANCDCYGHCYCYAVTATATATATTTATTTTDNILRRRRRPTRLAALLRLTTASEAEALTLPKRVQRKAERTRARPEGSPTEQHRTEQNSAVPASVQQQHHVQSQQPSSIRAER